MALFDKKSPAEKVIELFEKLSDDDKEIVKTHFGEKAEDLEKAEDEREIDKEEEAKADNEEIKDEKSEDEKEETEQVAEDVDKAEEEPEEKPEEEITEEDKGEIEKAEEDVEDAKDNKLEALLEEFAIYKEKVDKLFAKLDELEEPAENVGLGKQRSVEEAKDDNDLSAYEYAMKNARY